MEKTDLEQWLEHHLKINLEKMRDQILVKKELLLDNKLTAEEKLLLLNTSATMEKFQW